MKLSDFKDEKAIEIVAALLTPIGKIASNPQIAKAKNGNVAELASAMLKHGKREVMDMLAILSDVDPKKYHCTAATVLHDVIEMISDEEFMKLFGLQRQNPASSGSASENTEAPAQPVRSSNTSVQNRNRRRKKKHTRST